MIFSVEILKKRFCSCYLVLEHEIDLRTEVDFAMIEVP